MILILVVVGIVALMFVFGAADNNRPVATWPDEKLYRMHIKLLKAANAQFQLKNYDEFQKYADKAKEVEEEQKARAKKAVAALIEGLGAAANIVKDIAALRDRIMAEKCCSQEQANEVLSENMRIIANSFVAIGLSQQQANEKAIAQLLGRES